MTKVNNTVNIQFSTTITLTEMEIRALDALVGYGDEAFIRAFKENLGSYYIENYTDGLVSFFNAVRGQVLPAMRQIDGIRELVAKEPK